MLPLRWLGALKGRCSSSSLAGTLFEVERPFTLGRAAEVVPFDSAAGAEVPLISDRSAMAAEHWRSVAIDAVGWR